MNKNNVCNNCGKLGHLFHQCKLPITSYGIILFRTTLKGLQFLMIRRKDSFGYIDFIRGKYVPHNIEHLRSIFNEMSIVEKENIRLIHLKYYGLKCGEQQILVINLRVKNCLHKKNLICLNMECK